MIQPCSKREVNLGLAYQGLLNTNGGSPSGEGSARKAEPAWPNVIVGMDYLKLGSPEKAIPFLQRALKLDPSNRDAREALALSYLSQENFRGAAEQFRQSAFSIPTSRRHGSNSDTSTWIWPLVWPIGEHICIVNRPGGTAFSAISCFSATVGKRQ